MTEREFLDFAIAWGRKVDATHCPFIIFDGVHYCLKLTKEDGLELYVEDTCEHRRHIIGAAVLVWIEDEIDRLAFLPHTDALCDAIEQLMQLKDETTQYMEQELIHALPN